MRVHAHLQLHLLVLLHHPENRGLNALERRSWDGLGGDDDGLNHATGGLHQVEVLGDDLLGGGNPSVSCESHEEVPRDVGELVVEESARDGHLLLPGHCGVLEELGEGQRGRKRPAEGLQLALDSLEHASLARGGEERAGVPTRQEMGETAE